MVTSLRPRVPARTDENAFHDTGCRASLCGEARRKRRARLPAPRPEHHRQPRYVRAADWLVPTKKQPLLGLGDERCVWPDMALIEGTVAHFVDRPTMSKMPPICGSSTSRTSRSIAKSLPV